MFVEKVIKLKDGEKILGLIRQFPLNRIGPMILAIILFVAPFFFMIPLFSLEIIGAIVFGLLILVGMLLALRTIFCWYWTVFIITSCRVVDVDQRGFFDRFVSEASYEKIQDVAYARKGIFGTIFNYGTLVVQTAGASAHLEQYFVREPKDVQHLIIEAMSSHLAGAPGERNDKVSNLLEAASVLSNTEARAFITELKEAVDEEKKDVAGATEEQIKDFMSDNIDDDSQSIFDDK